VELILGAGLGSGSELGSGAGTGLRSGVGLSLVPPVRAAAPKPSAPSGAGGRMPPG